MNTMVIEVRRGIVTSVISEEDVHVIIADYDNPSIDQEVVNANKQGVIAAHSAIENEIERVNQHG